MDLQVSNTSQTNFLYQDIANEVDKRGAIDFSKAFDLYFKINYYMNYPELVSESLYGLGNSCKTDIRWLNQKTN